MIDYDKERTQDIWFVVSLYSVITILSIICGYFDTKTEVAANPMATIPHRYIQTSLTQRMRSLKVLSSLNP